MKEIKFTDLPTLGHVLLVEQYIKEHDGEFNKELLLKNLLNDINEMTINLILDFLIYSKKISIDSQGKLGWIYYPNNIEKHLENKNLFWRKDEASI